MNDETYEEKMHRLSKTATQLVSLGKGILAADESTPTITKRFESIKTESTAELRRAYRSILFTTEGLEQHISGVIMYDETINQKTFEGIPFPKYLSNKGILTGIKVDKGAKPMPLRNKEEKLTEGLDGLKERLEKYKKLGASFTKWRAVISIGKDIPSCACIRENAINLARFAAISQESGLVPIVEPEVLMDGTQNIDQSLKITEKVLKNTFSELDFLNVYLEGMILKCNMVLEGYNSLSKASPREVAEKTLKCLSRTVPPAVPGIAFLSGGQSYEDATQHLNLINKLLIPGIGKWPWRLSFSYGRALQQPALQAWKGNMDNVKESQAALLHRAKCNSEATMGVLQTGVHTSTI